MKKSLIPVGLEAEKSVTECFTGEKENRTNEKNDKQGADDIVIHNKICHTLRVYKRSS